MSGNSVGILEFRVAGNFMMAHSAYARLSGSNKCAPNAFALKGCLDMPTLDERDWR
jgi:hypothetical protein